MLGILKILESRNLIGKYNFSDLTFNITGGAIANYFYTQQLKYSTFKSIMTVLLSWSHFSLERPLPKKAFLALNC